LALAEKSETSKIKKPGFLPTTHHNYTTRGGIPVKRSQELQIDIDNMMVSHPVVPGKVLVLVIDGVQGKAKVAEAVEHGFTIVETAKGKTARIKYEESELF
jgi:Phage-like element PBSX protein XtrA